MKNLIYLVLFFSTFVNAQNHEAFLKLAFRADSAFGQGDYKKCADLYDLAFQADSQNVQGHKYMYCASCMALSKQEEKAFKYIYKAIDNGWVFYEDTKADPDLESLYNADDFQWDKMLDYFKVKVTEYEASLSHKELREQLLAMFDEDQYYRSKAHYIENEYGKGSRKMKKLWDTLQVVDSINLEVLDATFDKYGFPTYDMVGIDGVEAIFVLISHQHEHKEIRSKALPLAKEAENQLGVSKSDVAYLEDHVLQDQGKKQKYGTRIYLDRTKIKIWPIEDYANVNARRLSVEMRPLDLYVQEIKAVIPSAEDEIPVEYNELY